MKLIFQDKLYFLYACYQKKKTGMEFSDQIFFFVQTKKTRLQIFLQKTPAVL